MAPTFAQVSHLWWLRGGEISIFQRKPNSSSDKRYWTDQQGWVCADTVLESGGGWVAPISWPKYFGVGIGIGFGKVLESAR